MVGSDLTIEVRNVYPSSRMTKHKPHDERRQQILEAAMECFIRNGYAHTRVDDIAREAGLSKGGIYFHFPSKRDIFDALQEIEIERTMAAVMEAQQSAEPAVMKLQQLAYRLIVEFGSNEEHRKFLIVLAEMGIRNPDVRERVVQSHEAYLQMITQQIKGGIEAGEIRDMNPEVAALVLKLLMDGIEQAFALGYRVEPEKLLLEGLDVIVNGLAPRPEPS